MAQTKNSAKHQQHEVTIAAPILGEDSIETRYRAFYFSKATPHDRDWTRSVRQEDKLSQADLAQVCTKSGDKGGAAEYFKLSPHKKQLVDGVLELVQGEETNFNAEWSIAHIHLDRTHRSKGSRRSSQTSASAIHVVLRRHEKLIQTAEKRPKANIPESAPKTPLMPKASPQTSSRSIKLRPGDVLIDLGGTEVASPHTNDGSLKRRDTGSHDPTHTRIDSVTNAKMEASRSSAPQKSSPNSSKQCSPESPSSVSRDHAWQMKDISTNAFGNCETYPRNATSAAGVPHPSEEVQNFRVGPIGNTDFLKMDRHDISRRVPGLDMSVEADASRPLPTNNEGVSKPSNATRDNFSSFHDLVMDDLAANSSPAVNRAWGAAFRATGRSDHNTPGHRQGSTPSVNAADFDRAGEGVPQYPNDSLPSPKQDAPSATMQTPSDLGAFVDPGSESKKREATNKSGKTMPFSSHQTNAKIQQSAQAQSRRPESSHSMLSSHVHEPSLYSSPPIAPASDPVGAWPTDGIADSSHNVPLVHASTRQSNDPPAPSTEQKRRDLAGFRRGQHPRIIPGSLSSNISGTRWLSSVQPTPSPARQFSQEPRTGAFPSSVETADSVGSSALSSSSTGKRSAPSSVEHQSSTPILPLPVHNPLSEPAIPASMPPRFLASATGQIHAVPMRHPPPVAKNQEQGQSTSWVPTHQQQPRGPAWSPCSPEQETTSSSQPEEQDQTRLSSSRQSPRPSDHPIPTVHSPSSTPSPSPPDSIHSSSPSSSDDDDDDDDDDNDDDDDDDDDTECDSQSIWSSTTPSSISTARTARTTSSTGKLPSGSSPIDTHWAQRVIHRERRRADVEDALREAYSAGRRDGSGKLGGGGGGGGRSGKGPRR